MNKVNDKLNILSSPTFTSLVNLFFKTLLLLAVIPLVNNYFTEPERFFWYSITTLWSIIIIMEFGLTPTITRYFSYISGRRSLQNIINNSENLCCNDVKSIMTMFSNFFHWNALCIILILVPIEYISIQEKIKNYENTQELYFLFSFTFFCSFFYLKSNVYSGVLQGLGYLPKVQIIQGIMAIIAILLTSFSIINTEELLLPVISFFTPFLIYFFLIRSIAINKVNKTFSNENSNIFLKIKKELFQKSFNDSWKSGIGIFSSQGLILGSTFLVNKFESVDVAINYMLTLQIIRGVISYSNVPFYSLMPSYCKLYAQGSFIELKRIMVKRFFLSIFIFLSSVFSFTFFASSSFGIAFLGNNYDPMIWIFMSIAFFFERVGALLLQSYTVTGDIKWHISNSLTALIVLALLGIFWNDFSIELMILFLGISYLIWAIPYNLFLLNRHGKFFYPRR